MQPFGRLPPVNILVGFDDNTSLPLCGSTPTHAEVLEAILERMSAIAERENEKGMTG